MTLKTKAPLKQSPKLKSAPKTTSHANHTGVKASHASKNGSSNISSGASSGNPKLKKKLETSYRPAPAPIKTHLSDKQLRYYEDLLLAAKAKILHNIDNIESQNLNSHKDSSGDLSGYSLHMADVGTDNYDRELALNVVGSEQDIIYQIDEALDRIKQGSYGVCAMFSTPIPAARLEAIPWTAYSKEAQEKLEKEKKVRG